MAHRLSTTIFSSMNEKPLLFACFATFLYVLALALVIPFLPFQILNFGGSYASVGGIFSAFSAASFLSAPLWGRACDRWSVKTTLLASALLTLSSYLILFLAASLPVLYAARVLAGLAAGWLIACQTLVAQTTDNKERTRGLGLLGAAFGTGFAAGHALSAWLLGEHLVPAKTPVLVACAVVLAAIALTAMFSLKKNTSPRNDAADSTKRSSPQSQRRHKQRGWFDVLALFQTRALATVALVYFAVSLAFYGFEGTFAVWVEEIFAFGPRKVALLLTYASVVVIVVQGGIVGKVARRQGEGRVVLFGIASLACGLALLAFAGNLALLLLALTLIATGISCHNPAMQSLISQRTQRQGEIFGILQALTSLARTVAPFGFALVATLWKGTILYFFLAVALVVLLFLVRAFTLLEDKPSRNVKKA